MSDAIGCGDNSCVFKVLRGPGVGTNGGCRCFKQFRHWDSIEGTWNDSAINRVRQDTQRLADELRDEREVSESLRAQLHEAVERLDEFGSQPTLADGIQAMRLRLVELRARVAELEARRWIQCTSVSNECLGGCANAKEHDRHRHATLTHRAEKAEAERDEWRRQLRDAERYAAEQEMAYADLTAELAMVRAAGKELTMEFEGVEAERDALRAQVEAARTYARQALDYGEDCDASDLIRAMDEAKP
jgi:chromosome segregation ATPase